MKASCEFSFSRHSVRKKEKMMYVFALMTIKMRAIIFVLASREFFVACKALQGDTLIMGHTKMNLASS